MNDRSASRRLGPRLLHEPLVHFFILGALLFVGHRLTNEDPRAITITQNLTADLERRFSDQHGRSPDLKEREEILRAWKRDEALYREALRRDLDRNDSVVRAVLIEKMRAAAALEVPPPKLDDADLERFLRAHTEKYEVARRYDFQFLHFLKADPSSAEQIARALATLAAGSEPSGLGRPVVGGKLTEGDLTARVAAPLRERILRQAPGPWVRVEGEADLWLLRVRAVTGGLPNLRDIRERVLADATARAEEEAIERQLQKTVDLYHLEDTSHAE